MNETRQIPRMTPILNVYVCEPDGTVLADVDGRSTADVMAYYLSSRGIAETTEESVIESVQARALEETGTPRLYEATETVTRRGWNFATARMSEELYALTHDAYVELTGHEPNRYEYVPAVPSGAAR